MELESRLGQAVSAAWCLLTSFTHVDCLVNAHVSQKEVTRTQARMTKVTQKLTIKYKRDAISTYQFGKD